MDAVMLPTERQCDAALQIVAKLRAAGHEAYLAGGCVRDLLLGRAPKDYDVATAATPDAVLKMFPRAYAVGARFGVVLVDACNEADDGAAVTEVATFRCDGTYSDGRHPDGVRYTLSAEEDVRRRDFTINGLLLDVDKLFAQEPREGTNSSHKKELPSGAKQAAEKGGIFGKLTEDIPQGLKPVVFYQPLTARLKSCPDAMRPLETLSTSFSAACEARKSFAAFTARLKSCPDTKQPDTRQPDPKQPIETQSTSFSATGEAPEECFSGDSNQALRAAVIDYVGGVADLEAGVVRAIGRPEQRFAEDHLRMLRGVRFAARFGFALETETKLAIRALAAKIASVSRERVRDELTKMLTEGHARRAFELLDETGLLAEVLPEVARMKGVEQPPQFHPEGDVWAHTLLVLGQLEEGCSLTLAWGALLHDVGKPPTFRRAERIRFNGHVEVGVAMAGEICQRFRFSNGETRQTLALIENHMRFADARRMKASTLKRFFRLEDFPAHLALHRMDCLASAGNLENWEFVRERYESTPEEAVRPRPLLTGHDLIAAGYTPGPHFHTMLRAAEDAQLEGAVTTPAKAMTLILERFPIA
jgi:poly(A) polymerase